MTSLCGAENLPGGAVMFTFLTEMSRGKHACMHCAQRGFGALLTAVACCELLVSRFQALSVIRAVKFGAAVCTHSFRAYLYFVPRTMRAAGAGRDQPVPVFASSCQSQRRATTRLSKVSEVHCLGFQFDTDTHFIIAQGNNISSK